MLLFSAKPNYLQPSWSRAGLPLEFPLPLEQWQWQVGWGGVTGRDLLLRTGKKEGGGILICFGYLKKNK